MSEGKRKWDGRDKSKRRFRSNGTPIWGQRSIDGPGVWVTCVKGKEKQTVGELYDLFDHLASEMWPTSEATLEHEKSDEDVGDDEFDIEKEIAKEIASIKRSRKEQRFANCQTDTNCVVFISCRPPVDPVKLVVRHIENVTKTGVSQTRFTQRLTPISATCPTNIPEIQSLCTRLLAPILEEYPDGKGFTYKIELRMRNHNTLTRPVVTEELAKCVPEQHKVDLNDPEVFILVEIFKSVCGMSIVKDYYHMQKFNVMEIANARNEEMKFKPGEGRMAEKEKDSVDVK